MIDDGIFKQSLAGLLAEAFGMSENPQGFFLDSGQAGLLDTINQLDAATASIPYRPDEETIAAHTGHVRWLLNFFAAYERGETPAPDWAASWQTQVVDEPTWQALRSEIAQTYTHLLTRLHARTDWQPMAVSAWMMLLAHVSYHVGVIHKLRTVISK